MMFDLQETVVNVQSWVTLRLYLVHQEGSAGSADSAGSAAPAGSAGSTGSFSGSGR